MGNSTTKLRSLGCPEVTVNSVKQKKPEESSPARNVKKPRKAELNYLPPYPTGETQESLEQERSLIIDESKQRDNAKIISEKILFHFHGDDKK